MAKIEISKEEMNQQMMKKHHSEMVDAIKNIEVKENSESIKLLESLDKGIKELSIKITSIPQPKINIPKTEFDTKELVNLLSKMVVGLDELKKSMIDSKKEEKKEEKKKEFDFVIERNMGGYIQSVKAIEK